MTEATRPRSRVKQLADDEAARVEGAEPPEPDATADPPLEIVADPEPAEIDPEAAARALDAAERTYVEAVASALGHHFAELHPCPTCSQDQLGFVYELPNAGPDYRVSELTEACPTCNGWGDVLTGAKVDRGMLDQCNTCGGKGFIYKAGANPQAPAPVHALPPLPPLAATGDGEPRDAWGRRAGHPHWGLPPDTVG